MARSLRVEIIGDASSYQRALATSGKQTQTFGSTVAKTLGRAAAFTGLTVGVASLFKFGTEAVKQAAQVQKFEEAVRANFKGASKSILEFADSAPKLGLVDDAALQTAASFGILFKNLGIGPKRAAEMTVGFEKLGTAIATIKGQDPAEVISQLTLAAAGNTRGLKKMGIAIDTAAIKQEALKEGLLKTGQALTPTIKAQAIYALATKHLGEFQAQAAAHSDDFATKQRVLTAEWDQARQQLGTALLPAMTKLVTVLADNLPGAVRTVTAVVKALVPVFEAWRTAMLLMLTPMRVIIDLLRGDFSGAWDAIKAPVMSAVDTINDAFGGVAAKIGGYVGDATTAATNFGKGIYDGMVAGISGFGEWIGGRVQAGLAAITGAFGSALTESTTFGANILNGMKAGILGFVEWIAGRVTGGIAAITGAVGSALTAATSFGAAILSGLKDGILGFADWVAGRIAAAIGFITGAFQSGYNAAKGFGGKILDGIRDGVAGLLDLIKGPIESAIKWIEGAPGRVYAAAKELGAALYNGIKDGLGGIFGFLDSIIDKIKSVLDWAARIPSKLGFGNTGIDPPGPPVGQPNARGGPVRAGWAHLVGEKGPEMFVPSVSGRIIPNHKLGGSITIHQHIQGNVLTEQQLYEAAYDFLLRKQRSNVNLGFT